jgi:hypothetical protein
MKTLFASHPWHGAKKEKLTTSVRLRVLLLLLLLVLLLAAAAGAVACHPNPPVFLLHSPLLLLD